MAKVKGYQYEFPRPALTVDIALFRMRGEPGKPRLQVLLIKRGIEPCKGQWALPGGFVRQDEELDEAAQRELLEETGQKQSSLKQVRAVGTRGRDSRGHVVTVLYAALLSGDETAVAGGGDAAQASWFEIAMPPPLAFDHAELLRHALEDLRENLGKTPVCFQLLPSRFTLSDLQAVCEAILGRELDRRNFRRRILELGIVEEVPGERREGRHRPAKLFRFLPEAFAAHWERQKTIPF